MIILTVTGFKGGIGKSTTAFHLAAYFSVFGATVLVDGDPNRTAVKWAQRGAQPLAFTVVDERQAMRMVTGKAFVIIDTPARPESGDIHELAKGCDLLLLPTSPDVVSLEPMLETARALGEARYRALLTLVPPYPSREGETMRQELKEGGVPVCETMIRRTVGFAKAALAGCVLRDLADTRLRAGWADYQALGDEIRSIL